MIRKLILITGLMLSANLWANYDFKVCSSFDYKASPNTDLKYLERCVTKYLNEGYELWGDTYGVTGNIHHQALYKFKR